MAERVITVSAPSEVKNHIPNIGGIIAEACLKERGFYTCTFGGVKTFVEVVK
jgi:hypothetical protein